MGDAMTANVLTMSRQGINLRVDFPEVPASGNVEYVPRWNSSMDLKESYTENEDIGNGDGFANSTIADLPAFADQANKALHEETKALGNKLATTEKSLKDESERVATMTEHLKYVQQEMEHTNNFLAAKSKEISTEQHLRTLSLRERGRFQQEIAHSVATLEIERGRFKTLQHHVSKARKDIEAFKASMNWNQEELEQWASAAAQKDDDNLALQKYARADEAKIKELSLILEKLASTAAHKRAELDNESTETQVRQVELERTAQFFKARHSERNILVKQWRTTIKTMRQRDDEINKISQDFLQPSSVKESQLRDLKLRRLQLELLEIGNDELQRDLDEKERLNQSKKQENASMRTALQSFKDELESLEYESEALTSSLMKRKTECEIASQGLSERCSQLNLYEQRCQEIKEHLDELKNVTLSKENDTKKIEKFVSDHKGQLADAEKYLEKLKQLIFKESQRLNELSHSETNLTAEIRSAQSMAKNMTAKVHGLQGTLLRQRELLYNAEYQHHLMERKVARGLGERSDEEKQSLQASISELETNLKSLTDKKADLVQRSRKVKNELRAWIRQRDQRQQDEKHLLITIDEIELEISACETRMKSQVTSKEELMLSDDMMHLELGRLRNKLAQGTEEICNLENQHRQLEDALAEKKDELLAYSEIKSAQVRAAEDDRHKAALELGKRKIAIEKLQSKYETIVKRFHQGDAAGSSDSQVLHLITAAQKREELLQQGDELDKQIRLKERELQAMRRTLEHIQGMNSEFRLSLSKADMTSERAKELRGLEGELDIARKNLVVQRERLYLEKSEHAHLSGQLNSLRHATVSLQDCLT